MGEIQRLFLAVPIPPVTREAIAAHLAAHAGTGLPGRPVPAENWHLTLRFLGDTPPAAAQALERGVRAAELGASFALTLGGCGAFPRPARASVLWLGVDEGREALGELARRVEAAARGAGFAPEGRPFAAHLTLSRLRQPEDARPVLERIPPLGHRMPVDEVVLFRSHLGSGAPRYEAVARFPLA